MNIKQEVYFLQRGGFLVTIIACLINTGTELGICGIDIFIGCIN